MTYVDRIIDAFGGIRPMADAIGKTASTVQGWKSRGSIPDNQKANIWANASKAKKKIEVEHFVPFDGASQDPDAATHAAE